MASCASQRQTVVSPMEATRPRRTTSPWMSDKLKRENGRPALAGSSHARALTAMTTLGGKADRTSSSRLLLQAEEPLLMEALSPLADDLPRRIETRRDLVVTEPLGCEQDDLGTNDIAIR